MILRVEMHANRVFTIVSLVPRVSSRILLLRRRTGQRSGAKNVVVRMGEGGKGKKGTKKKIWMDFKDLVIVLN